MMLKKTMMKTMMMKTCFEYCKAKTLKILQGESPPSTRKAVHACTESRERDAHKLEHENDDDDDDGGDDDGYVLLMMM